MNPITKMLKRIAGPQTESGQAIVLVALFMVVLLAMVGVAVDGGSWLWLYRDAKNAADTAALQAAYHRCTSSVADYDWHSKGLEAAFVNGFEDPGTDANDDGIYDALSTPATAAEITNVETNAGDEAGTPDVIVEEVMIGGKSYVQVTIEDEAPKYFIGLVYAGPLEVQTQALVYCQPATDYQDWPGITALGGCECSGVADNRIDLTGSASLFQGDIHSNCDLRISGNASDPSTIDGDVSASGGDDGVDPDTESGNINLNHVSIVPPGTQDDEAETLELPAVIPPELYFPGGEIYEAINDATPGRAQYFNEHDDDISTAPGNSDTLRLRASDSPLEGLYAVDGNVVLQSGISFGSLGFTIVATGTIDYGDVEAGGTLFNYYGWDPDADPGVTIDYSLGTGSAILMYSTMNTIPACGSSADTIILGGHSSSDPGYPDLDEDIDLYGLIYTPYGRITWSGSSITFRGVMISQTVDLSGARSHYISEPDVLQPMAPVLSNTE